MTDKKSIQLSYCLLHLTKEDLNVIKSINDCIPGLDLNHFGLSLLFLGHIFCTDKQKIFLNGPMNHDFDNLFTKPIRLRFNKESNIRLFNAINKLPQGKLRRNYLTALIHTGVASLIELFCLYRIYKEDNDLINLYKLNTFALKFGLDTYLDKFTVNIFDFYEYEIQYLINKFSKYISNDVSPIKNSVVKKAKNVDKPDPKPLNTSNVKPVNLLVGNNDSPPISATNEKSMHVLDDINQKEDIKTNFDLKKIDKSEGIKSTNDPDNKGSNWLQEAFNPNLL